MNRIYRVVRSALGLSAVVSELSKSSRKVSSASRKLLLASAAAATFLVAGLPVSFAGTSVTGVPSSSDAECEYDGACTGAYHPDSVTAKSGTTTVDTEFLNPTFNGGNIADTYSGRTLWVGGPVSLQSYNSSTDKTTNYAGMLTSSAANNNFFIRGDEVFDTPLPNSNLTLDDSTPDANVFLSAAIGGEAPIVGNLIDNAEGELGLSEWESNGVVYGMAPDDPGDTTGITLGDLTLGKNNSGVISMYDTNTSGENLTVENPSGLTLEGAGGGGRAT